MANAGFGLPVKPDKITLDSESSGTPDRSFSNALNDEQGLVYSDSVANAGNMLARIALDANTSDVSFLSVLGLNENYSVRLRSFASLANLQSGTSPTVIFDWTSALSTNRTSSFRKFFKTFNASSAKYFDIAVRNDSGSTQQMEFWRVLIGRWIEPADNIEIKARALLDDRQRRQYTDTGGRNFIDYGRYPAFSGNWPWLSETEYKEDFKDLMLNYGASVPVLFCLDYEDTTWGEDDLYYGDLEKRQEIVLDDGQLYQFSFSIVDIASVE